MFNNLHLIPTSNLIMEPDRSSWRSTSEDPTFILENHVEVFKKKGWYKLELKIKTNTPSGLSKVYFDFGSGFEEISAISLPFSSDKIESRVFQIDDIPKCVRFDPLELVAKFKIVVFSIQKISLREVKNIVEEYWLSKYKTIGNFNSFDFNLVFRFYNFIINNNAIINENKLERVNKKSISLVPTLSAHKLHKTPRLKKSKVNKITLAAQTEESLRWRKKPFFTIIIPCFNSNKIWLQRLLTRIARQSYRNWECIIIDDGSSAQEHIEQIGDLVSRDSRFKFVKNKINKGVGATLLSGVERATGEYVVVVDHDDLVELHALYEFAKVIRAKSPDVIYSDEALINSDGKLIRYENRPDFNYQLLLSHPYIVHLTCIRKSIIETVGNYNSKLRISHDYDLLLRICAVTKDFQHIPKVLYQWRIHENSQGHLAKDQVTELSIRALNNHLNLLGIAKSKAWFEPSDHFNFYRLRAAIPKLTLSIVIDLRTDIDVLQHSFESLYFLTHMPRQVKIEIIFACRLNEGFKSNELLVELSKVKVKLIKVEASRSIASLYDQATKVATGEFILFIDTHLDVVDPMWLSGMLEIMFLKKFGLVGQSPVSSYGGLRVDSSVLQFSETGSNLLLENKHVRKWV